MADGSCRERGEMMKTPDEIKKGLECCTIPLCAECPYDGEASCVVKNEDALAYIQQLEEKYERAMENAKILSDAVTQLEAEKNQLLEDLADHCGSKTLCKKYEDGTCPHEYDCTLYLSTCEDYEWRGLPEV